MEVVTERETKAQISMRQSKINNRYLGSSCPTCNKVFNWKPALYKHMPACAKKSDQVINSIFLNKKQDSRLWGRIMKYSLTKDLNKPWEKQTKQYFFDQKV